MKMKGYSYINDFKKLPSSLSYSILLVFDLFLIALACHHRCRHGLHFVHERDLVTTIYLCQKTL